LDSLSAFSKARLEKLWKITKGEMKDEDYENYDSDNDVYNVQFSENSRVDFLDKDMSWVEGKVVTKIEEMIKVKGEHSAFWLEIESDRLAPPGTMSQNEKQRIHKFYVELLKASTNQNGQD
jgi:hypothetical protein